MSPGAGSSDKVMFRKVLPTSNQGSVQVEMLSLLPTLGVCHCFQDSLLQRWFVTLKLADSWQWLVWYRSGAGKDIQLLRTHQASQPWACVTEMPSAVCLILEALRLKMCYVLCKKGNGGNYPTGASVRNLLSSCLLVLYQDMLSSLSTPLVNRRQEENKVKILPYIV